MKKKIKWSTIWDIDPFEIIEVLPIIVFALIITIYKRTKSYLQDKLNA